MKTSKCACVLAAAAAMASSACGASDVSSAGSDATTGSESGTGGSMSNGGGSTESGGSSAGGGNGEGAGWFLPAKHPATPKIVSLGGPIISSAKIVPVFFANDDAGSVSDLGAFVSAYLASDTFAAAVASYGTASATVPMVVHAADTPTGTLDDADVQAWLTGKLNAGDPSLPAADASTVFVLFYPAGVTITLDGNASCSDFDAYHDEAALDAAHDNLRVAYAVVPRCSLDGPGYLADHAGSAATAEIVAAVTDPAPLTDPAYASFDADHVLWAYFATGEVGNACAFLPAVKVTGLAHPVSRTWSNTAAEAGKNPCIPGAQPYVDAAPVLGHDLGTGGKHGTLAAKIHVGSSATIDLDLFSDRATAPFDLDAVDLGSAEPKHLAFTFDKKTGRNGDVRKLKIDVRSAGPDKFELALVTASRGGKEIGYWVLPVDSN